MNARQRRTNRRKLGRQFGVTLRPNEFVRIEFAGAEYEAMSIDDPRYVRCGLLTPVRLKYSVTVMGQYGNPTTPSNP